MYEELIKDLLSLFYIKKPPIKPEIIAYGLGVEVHFQELPSQISGILYNHNDHPMILINKRDNPLRQRFTIAHELGHFLLHHSNTQIYFDYPISKNPKLEKEANTFAASLLLPDFFLKRYLNLPYQKISSIFQVSQKVIEIRLKDFKTI
ncbi:MAG: ImmA/IrrE family metallo-endopeptidase [Dictyoglomus thermophilum]|uniref:ImmA/IrrE family metallo-endopeptidase n=1 Tax=Dictyoglomus thermophilum TaxID=14 RepID=A0A7V4DXF6_DICTH|nr:ImmA/IrrE family metallo-endopeptidase [Dictyoglomus thermophilum]MCX7720255.1 ImmA/IrrE family metallo-endopeptidase [Dictyoglomus thermophilum]TYT23282.1 ImmA/IrrE family metallo-endopeptidase [Dictyoglomus thermophilum]